MKKTRKTRRPTHRLSQQFEREITQSELVYLFVLADREHSAEASDQPWPGFYAQVIVDEFLP